MLKSFTILPVEAIEKGGVHASLILPEALPLLIRSPPPAGRVLCLQVNLNNCVVALAIAEVYEQGRSAQLFSFVVAEAFRGRRIGTALFKELQDILYAEGIHSLGFEYEQTSPFAPILEKILFHHHWLQPQLYLIRSRFKSVDFNPRWLNRSYAVPGKVTLFPWAELSSEERQVVNWMDEQGHFIPALSPFQQEDRIEPVNSLGLRCEGRLIGWLITHRVNPETIRYSSLFLEREFLLSGYGIFLLVQSIQLQKQTDIPDALFEVNLEKIDPSWLRFVKRRLLPYAYSTEKMKWAFHSHPL